jgi:hypothetical protein
MKALYIYIYRERERERELAAAVLMMKTFAIALAPHNLVQEHTSIPSGQPKCKSL